MRTWFAGVLALVCSCAGAVAQPLKHEKYQLPNGLTVILHEDRSLPVATINLWYRVGARNEPKGRSGFAHLYEHLMFMGTRRVPGNDFDVVMETGGGANNASTSLDRTNYFSSGPSSLLPTLLWLDADRMEDMGPTMDLDKLNKQRDVVRNEIRQNVENAPYGRAYEWSYKYLYPEGHPYHNGVYGTHEDLEAATVIDVKDFFATFYAPNNCSLVVAGDFDSAQIKPLIERLFGSIPRGNVSPQAPYPPAKLDRAVRVTMLDKVQLPKIAVTYHSPASYSPGDAETMLLAQILADGKSSRLYRRLVEKDQSCVEVSAYQDGAALGSLLRIELLARPDADLTAVERALDEELASLVEKGPTQAELDQRQIAVEAGMLSSLQKVGVRADRLNEYEYYWGTPDGLQRDLERFRSATPQSVQRVAASVLTPAARLIIRVLPEQSERTPSPRDQRPADATSATFAPQAPASFTLSNGLNVLVWNRPELPLAAMTLVVSPGGCVEPINRSGVTALAADMLSEGAGDRDGPAFAEAVQALGGSFGADAGRESLTVGATVIARNFDAMAALFADAVARPRFNESDFNRVKGLHLENLAQMDEVPGAVASFVSARLLFGDQHPYGRRTAGEISTVEPLTLADVKAQYQALVRPDAATLLVAGAVTPEQAKATLERTLGAWKGVGQPVAPPAAAALPERTGTGLRIYLVHRPQAVQTVIQFRMPGMAASDPRRVHGDLINVILGGSFTSRLNQNLREKNGYTYGARSGFDMGRTAGSIVASSAVKADVTGAALKEFFHELGRTAGGDITQDEATKAAKTFRADTVQGFESLSSLLGTYAGLIAAGLPLDTVAADYAAAERLDAKALNGETIRLLQAERGVLVLVGDRDLVTAQLKAMGLPKPIEVDASGKQIAP